MDKSLIFIAGSFLGFIVGFMLATHVALYAHAKVFGVAYVQSVREFWRGFWHK